jgi:hypothetical protein
MATVTLRRSDLFPVAQSVGIYPAAAKRSGQAPTSAVIASAAVDAAGLLTVTNAGILSYTDYVAYASVGGEHRYATLRSTLDAHGSSTRHKAVGASWPAAVAARRTAAGTG